MGNTILCENYYCQSVSFKPEWLSESSWNSVYNYDENIKPYKIDKGILNISNVKKFDILFQKKLLIDFNDTDFLSVPLNFNYNINKTNIIDIYIIFSSKELILENINSYINNNHDLFYVNLKLYNNKIFAIRSFNSKIITKKIKSKKINSFNINIENNMNNLIITEKLFSNNIKSKYEEKYINNYDFKKYNNLYLSLYIIGKNGLSNNNNEFIKLNFD